MRRTAVSGARGGDNGQVPALDEWFPGASTPDRRVDGRGVRTRRRARGLLRLAVASAVAGSVVALLATPAVGGAGIGAREAMDWWQELPADLPFDEPLPQRSVILAGDGRTVIATFYGENRVPVKLAAVPDVVLDAVLAVEDDRFYEHGPVDVRGTVRALANNYRGGSRQGGSGITQQYVKNLLLSEARTEAEQRAVTAVTPARKLREAWYAVEAERVLGKDGVLEAYLNTVYFGRGAYGIGAAAERYFGVPVARLTLAQAATLAGILKSPTYYDPVAYPKASRARRDVVLDRMVETGRISAAEAAKAKARKLVTRLTQPANGCARSTYPFFCQLVRDTIATDPAFGATPEAREQFLYRGGMRIVTTIDPKAMAAAQAAVDEALEPTNRVATAIAVVQPGTGEVKAIATNRRWGVKTSKGQTEVILPAVKRFQPGSTFKPITLATALEQGFSPYTRFDTPDGYVPASMNYPSGGFHNDDDSGHGVIDAYTATAESVNTYYVQLVERTGVLPVADMAARLGISSIPRSGPRAITRRDASLTLGSYEVSPIEMAAAYASLAAHGKACRPVVIRRLTLVDGTEVTPPSARCQQVVAPAVADTVSSVLTGTFSSIGTASGLELPGRPTAGKTGTTNNSGATWFAGYTPQLAAAVWVGDPRGPAYALRDVSAYGTTFETVYGRSIAGPVWREAMTRLHARLPVVPFPRVDPATLVAARPSVPDVRGLPRDAAITVLLQAGYRVRVDRRTAAPDALLAPGAVVAQTPAGGAPQGPGTLVTLVLSDGSDTRVRIPEPGVSSAPSS